MEENIANRILDKDLENIVKKVASGKPLSSVERARVESAYVGKGKEPMYAKNLTELAGILEVSRPTINSWRKIKGAPKVASNGSHSILKWREFIRKNELKEADTPEETTLKLRKLLAEVCQAELKLKTMEGQYVSIEKIREVWTTHIGQVRSILESRLLNELPPLLTAMDAIQIREKLRDVLDEAYAAIAMAASEIKEPVDAENDNQ